ncbi:MAG: hypothetical protein KKB81_03315 [Candidatus Margulisbacteria bacterium]|nr:hypothetical protein [Candidatus Margulisiibacteriota bacterium]MBU1022275.1 hypothetical protein [Candidatus Margulisiibacteriota bacterium]MBU1729286.1 hypothetical protein [Candidatus Margulisiibacteriota bacterium]MBU1955559.1 hypothetical protein [Candidatus Margulisiibacteriota bacterium]
MTKSKAAVDKNLVTISWSLFLIMIGGLWLAPAGQVPESTWLLGVGIILLGLNIVRYLNGIMMSWFSVILGAVAMLIGFAGFYGVRLPIFPIIVIIIGLSILLDVVNKK